MTEEYSLGFDLGGTQVRAALVQNGAVLQRAAMLTDVAGGPDAVMQQFKTLADKVSRGLGQSSIKSVGIAAPGPLDTVSGVVDHIPTLPGWDGFALRDKLSALFDRPATVENDGVAAVYGEWKHGAGRGLEHLVYVTVSTGVGGGVVVDGRLMHGRRGMGGHVGHFRIAPDGPICSCGAVGCFEAFAAGTALGKRARAAAEVHPQEYLGRLSQTTRIESRHAVDGAREGDPQSLALIREEAELLGVGFTGLIHLYSPQKIIMGGGVAKAFDLMSDDIHAIIRRDAMAPFKAIEVVPAALGDNCGLVGAASLALSNS
ncbi:ROK family protein [Rhizobium leguminosarum]|uniref:ROK family protein n=1 Tax=Rhizobium leguminosarum TaxID=384 RepID=UPI001C94BC54|nr:ROK family protein [Rhizobium leguminosarum]MBY5406444.1 ROK family protein [Rhizobium leguminosarum]